jgi:O-antigen/teichoic acid export membrane protein
MGQLQTIAKNSSVLLISQVLSYILTFFATIYIARYLGTDGFGILSFALAFTGMVSIFADMGLNTLVVREVARNKSSTDQFLTNVLVIKTILAVFTVLIVILVINALNYPPETVLVVYLLALSIILNSVYGVFNAIFQAHEKMEYQAVGQIINSATLFAIVLMAIYLNLSVVAFAFNYLVTSAVVLVYSVIIFLWKFYWPKFRVDISFWKPALQEAWPYGLIGIFSMVYVWIDSFFLSFFQGNEAVGIYNAAYRLVLVFLFIPTVFNLSIFPVMSQFYINSQNSLRMTVGKYFDFMVLIGTPLAVGTLIMASEIILLIFGASFSESIIALQILIWSTLFIFLNSPLVQLMSAIDKQSTLSKIVALCMVVNVILNLIFIPRFSYLAASIITVITEFLVLSISLYIAKKIGYDILKKKSNLIIKVALASGISGTLLLYFKDFNLPLTVIAAALLYLVLIYLSKCIDPEDIQLIKDSLSK